MDGLFFTFLTCFIVILLVFLPIYVEIDGHYDMNRRKLGFAIYLYKAFKVLGGYIATYPGGLALHVSPRKAILIPYSKLDSERKRFSFMRTFHLNKLSLTTETGAEYLFLVSLAHTVLRGYFFAKGGERKGIENNLWLTDGDVLRVSLTCVVRFNIFIVLCNVIRFLKEKIRNLWRIRRKKSII